MYILKLLLRNAFRHKLRTGLTILSITIAILSFGLLRTFIGAWYAGAEASSANRLVTRNAVSLIFPLPLSYKDKIRQVDGVKNVSWGQFFGGVYKDEKNFFANYAYDAKSAIEVYPEFILPPDQKEAFPPRSKGMFRRAETCGEIPLAHRGHHYIERDRLPRQLGVCTPWHIPRKRREYG